MVELSPGQIKTIARTNTNAIKFPRTTRQINQSVATSMPAGKMVPLMSTVMLRHDRLRNSMIHCKVDLMETAEIVKNPIKVRFMAYFVPFLAFGQFDGGMDEFNRSYMKQNNANGGTVTPFFNSRVAGAVGSSEIHKYLGYHAAPTDVINTYNEEAYNLIWNFRARNRSETLWNAKKRLLTNTTLAPAFWQHEQYRYLVPDWDDVAMEGAVDLTFTSKQAFVKHSDTSVPVGDTASLTTRAGQQLYYGSGTTDVRKVFADLESSGIKLSLANLELAKRTQWYADLKAQFEGLPDTYVIDLLMQGVAVPEQMWKQPILIADKTEIFGIEKRWATDGANLTDAVVNGAAMCDLDIALPETPTGGVLMVLAEILPEQLWERARDPLMYITDPAKLPNALRDDLDPQKVERFALGQFDTSHATPNGLGGYVPLNWLWQQSNVRIGGKWFKSAPSNSFNEERQHFWTPEVTNPAYNSDFMIAETFNTLPFVVTNQDIGEVQIQGATIIEGNTQFGTALVENDNAYVEVLNQVDKSRIVKGS